MKPKLIPTIIGLVPTLLLIPSILENTTTKYSFVNKIQSNYGMLKQQHSQIFSQDLNQGDNDNSGIDEEEKSKKARKQRKKKKKKY